MGFVCSVCGERHEELLLDVRMGLPEAVFVLSEREREERAEVSEDSAILRVGNGDDRYFVRGLASTTTRSSA